VFPRPRSCDLLAILFYAGDLEKFLLHNERVLVRKRKVDFVIVIFFSQIPSFSADEIVNFTFIEHPPLIRSGQQNKIIIVEHIQEVDIVFSNTPERFFASADFYDKKVSF